MISRTIIITVVVLAGCGKDSGVISTIPDPRHITWTVDTLDTGESISPQSFRIRALSSANLYLIGHDDSANSVLYKYNGFQWTTLQAPPISVVLVDLFPTSSGSGIAVGFRRDSLSSAILQWSGNIWQMVPIQPKGKLNCIWGNSPTEIWAGGYSRTLYRYDGVSWQLVNYDSTVLTLYYDTSFVHVHDIVGRATVGYNMMVHDWVQGQAYNALLRFESGAWRHVMGFGGDQDHINALWLSPSGKVFVGDRYFVREMQGSDFVNNFAMPSRTDAIHGSSPRDVFAVGSHVSHYNGTDWFEFSTLRSSEVHYISVWTDGPSVFLAGTLSTTSQKVVVARGHRNGWAP
jgi:hypothetical protein